MVQSIRRLRTCNIWIISYSHSFRSFCVFIIVICIFRPPVVIAAESADTIALKLSLPPQRYASTRPSSASHLEEDLRNPSQLLAAYVGSLGEIKAGDRYPTYIVGSGNKGFRDGTDAMFDEITGFAQVNANLVLIADHGNNCVRKVDRIQKLTSTAAGKCGDAGWRDGTLGQSRFDQPYNIIKSLTGKNTFFVTDHNNHAIREIDLDAGTVSTFLKDEDKLYFPIAMVIDKSENMMYVTMRYSVVSIDLSTREIVRLSGDRGDKIALVKPKEVLITDNPRDYIRRGKRSVLTQIDTANATRREVLVWPHDNEYPRSLFLNATAPTDKTVYVSERDVVLSLRITNGTDITTTPAMKSSSLNPGVPPNNNDRLLETATETAFKQPYEEKELPVHQGQEKGQSDVTTRSVSHAATYSTTIGRINVMTHIYMVIPSALVPALLVIIVVSVVLLVIRRRKLRKHTVRKSIHRPEEAAQNELNDNKNHVYQWLISSPTDEAAYSILPAPRPTNPYEEIREIELLPLNTENDQPSYPVQVTDDRSWFGSHRSINTVSANSDDYETERGEEIDHNHNINNSSSMAYRDIGSPESGELTIAFEEDV